MSRLVVLARSSARCLGIAVLSVAILSLLGGGTCVWTDDDDSRCYDDDAGNDGGCDDDFNATAGDDFDADDGEVRRQLDRLPSGTAASLGGTPSVWVLGGDVAALAASLEDPVYRLNDPRAEASSDPRRHPTARWTVSDGPSLTESWRLAVWSPADLTVFAEQIRRVNDDLLGLPPAFGELRHAGTHVLDTIVAVVYDQFPTAGIEPFAGARQVLVFDGHGRLIQVENDLVVPPGAGVPPPEAWVQR